MVFQRTVDVSYTTDENTREALRAQKMESDLLEVRFTDTLKHQNRFYVCKNFVGHSRTDVVNVRGEEGVCAPTLDGGAEADPEAAEAHKRLHLPSFIHDMAILMLC